MSYVTGADSRSTDFFAGANTIRAMPITTSTAEPELFHVSPLMKSKRNLN
jgi:hypothetical protein